MRLVLCGAPVLESSASETFLVEVSGNSLQEIGIYDGDVLLVHRVEGDSNLVTRNSLAVRSSADGLVIEWDNGHNGYRGVVSRIVRCCFQGRLNQIELEATLGRR